MNVVETFLADQHRQLRPGLPHGGSTLVLTPQFRASSHVIFLVFPSGARQPSLVAKTPRLADGCASLTREAANLTEVQGLRPGGFDSIPQLIAFEPVCGRPLLVETAISGRLMSPAYVRGHLDHCVRLMSDWLIELQRASIVVGHSVVGHNDWFGSIAGKPLERFRSQFPVTADEDAMIERTLEAAATLVPVRLPYVFEHGDMSHPNLVLTSRHGIGVLDWELAKRHGLIAADLFVFLAYVAFSCSRKMDAGSQVSAVNAAFAADGWGTRAATNYAQRAGIDEEWLSPLFLLCWARYTAALLDRLLDGDAGSSKVAHENTAAWLRANRYYLLWKSAASTARPIGTP